MRVARPKFSEAPRAGDALAARRRPVLAPPGDAARPYHGLGRVDLARPKTGVADQKVLGCILATSMRCLLVTDPCSPRR